MSFPVRNLINHTFGRLTVTRRGFKRLDGKAVWKCDCLCGNEVEVRGDTLVRGTTKSCGCLQRERVARACRRSTVNLTGRVFHRLTVLRRIIERGPNKAIKWECLCRCGNRVVVQAGNLCNGNTRSCGCLVRTKNTKHGLTKTRGYKRAKAANRHAAKLRRTPRWANVEAIRLIYANCPPGMVVDHIIPLRGKVVSGLHVESNLQYLAPRANGQKLNKFKPEYITRNLHEVRGICI